VTREDTRRHGRTPFAPTWFPPRRDTRPSRANPCRTRIPGIVSDGLEPATAWTHNQGLERWKSRRNALWKRDSCGSAGTALRGISRPIGADTRWFRPQEPKVEAKSAEFSDDCYAGRVRSHLRGEVRYPAPGCVHHLEIEGTCCPRLHRAAPGGCRSPHLRRGRQAVIVAIPPTAPREPVSRTRPRERFRHPPGHRVTPQQSRRAPYRCRRARRLALVMDKKHMAWTHFAERGSEHDHGIDHPLTCIAATSFTHAIPCLPSHAHVVSPQLRH
jgi:hypothetical protein